MVDLKPKLLVTNKWWRDSKLGITKNLSLRFVYSIFNVIRTAKEFTVLLAGILGVLLLVFSFWLVHTSDVQEQKVRGALIDIDEFFDDVIGGLNYLTTELPNEVTTFANNSVMILEQTGNSFLNDAAKYVEIGINKLVKGVQDSVNSVARWGYRISGRNQNDAPQIQLPTVDVPDKVLPDYWRPVIPWLDLSSARIPDRPFSAERECYPVVQKVYDIPRTTAYYAKVIGSILCGYAGLRLLIALITAFIPHCELYCCGGGFMKCMKLTGQSAENFFGTLARPWIHIPITVGIMLVLLCVLFLNPGIKQVDRDIRIPLKLADEQTAFAIGFVNDYIEKLPKDAIDFLNDQLRYIEGDVRTILTPSVYDLLRGVNTVIRTVNLEINDFLDGIDAGEVTIPTVDNSEGGLLLPRRLLPDIPHIPTDEMLIPPDLVALEPPLSPWIDDRIEEMNGISNQIIEVAIYLIAIPGIVVFWNTSKIWIPHKITEFFLHPPFDEETEHTKIPAATQLDLEAEE